MLDFYLGTSGIKNTGKHIGSLSSDTIYWLQQNKFILEGKTAHLPDDPPESFPVGDDVILNNEQVKKVYIKFTNRVCDTDFESSHINALESILRLAIDDKSGLSTIAD